jgi:hypothetical protein
MGSVCRASTSSCDPQEVCSGANPSCPADLAQPPANCAPYACTGAVGCVATCLTSADCADSRRAVCVAGQCRIGKLVFLTSVDTLQPSFGGLAAGDTICQDLATDAGIGGTYRAWLSDSTANALDRMTDGNPWYLVHNSTDPGFPAEVGPRVFNNKAGLQISPMTGINRDEYGTVITSTQAAWTGTRSNGQVEASLHCSNWATVATTSQAIHGQTNATSTAWTMGGLSYCMTGLRLYCLEQ